MVTWEEIARTEAAVRAVGLDSAADARSSDPALRQVLRKDDEQAQKGRKRQSVEQVIIAVNSVRQIWKSSSKLS